MMSLLSLHGTYSIRPSPPIQRLYNMMSFRLFVAYSMVSLSSFHGFNAIMPPSPF